MFKVRKYRVPFLQIANLTHSEGHFALFTPEYRNTSIAAAELKIDSRMRQNDVGNNLEMDSLFSAITFHAIKVMHF